MSEVNDEFEVTGAVGANIVPAPAGNHMAVCVGVVVLGTIEQKYKEHVKRDLTVRLWWELVNEKHVFDEAKGPEPFRIWKDFKLSMNAKSNLRKNLESWRGTKFTEQEAKVFNIGKLLGVACLCNVVHQNSKSTGNVYAQVATVTPVPKGTVVPAPVSPILKFNWKKPNKRETFMQEAYDKLPKFVQEKIQTSDEWAELMGGTTQASTTPAATVASGDDLPF